VAAVQRQLLTPSTRRTTTVMVSRGQRVVVPEICFDDLISVAQRAVDVTDDLFQEGGYQQGCSTSCSGTRSIGMKQSLAKIGRL
jgi:hypothetical protein